MAQPRRVAPAKPPRNSKHSFADIFERSAPGGKIAVLP